LSGRRDSERGQIAVYAILLFPLLMLVLVLVLAVGTLEDLRTRIGAELDTAALTATQALDVQGLAAGQPPRLVPGEADALAREYVARNIAASGDLVAESPASIAAGAQVVVTNGSGVDPLTGVAVTAPTVSIRVEVPARVPLLSLVGIGPVVTLTVTGSAAART